MGKEIEKSRVNMSRVKYYGLYTIVFLLTSLLIYLPFILNGKSFVFCDEGGGGDGLVQHYNSFVYYGEYLRGIIRTLLTEHRLVIPMFDFSIGYGQDIIKTLSYYVIGDPFSFCSVFIPVEHSEIGYSLLILARMYFAGVAFSAYARRRGCDSVGTLIGSIIYVFSSFGVVFGILHPYFINPLIYLPLICIGVDKILEGRSPLHFIFAVAIAALSNFYFFYMLVIMTVIYTALRYLEMHEKWNLGHIVGTVLRFLGYGIAGSLMASVLLVPALMGIVSSSRVGGTEVPLLYEGVYYADVLEFFLSGSPFRNYPFMGYTVIALIAIAILILKGKDRKGRTLKAALVIGIVFIAFPFFGHAFNGFSYVTNRWIWGFGFLISLIVSTYITQLRSLSTSSWGAIFVTLAIFTMIPLFVDERMRSISVISGIIISWIVLLIVFVITRGRRESFGAVIIALTTVSLFNSAFMRLMPVGGNVIEQYMDMNTSYKTLTEETPGALVKKYEEKSTEDDIYPTNDFFRYDAAHFNNENSYRNSSMPLRLNSTAYYYSMTNPSVNNIFSDMYLNFTMEQSFANLDSRSMLEAIMGVKYGITFKDDGKYAPYGFDNRVSEDDRYALYSTDMYLPFGFTTNAVIPKEVYDSLDPVEKQQAMLQGVSLEGEIESIDRLSRDDLSFDHYELEWDVTSMEGVEVSRSPGGEVVFTVTSEEATAQIEFPEVAGGELYIIYEDIDYIPNPSYREDVTQGLIRTVSDDGKTAWTAIKNERDNYYCGRHNFLSNLHYTDEARSSFEAIFYQKGEYRASNIRLVFQPVDSLEQRVEGLGEYYLRDLTIKENEFTGSISIPDNRVMVFSIPHSDGWRAYVDGEEIEPVEAYNGLMAIELAPGEHRIQFRYRTPYLIFSGLLSVFTAVGLIIWYNVYRKREVKPA